MVSKNTHKKALIKSPLRYPGGKSKAIAQISQYLPSEFYEYREPFVGGGALFIFLKQKFPDLKIWINDLNTELFLFWQYAQTNLSELIAEIRQVKATCTDGKLLFKKLTDVNVKELSNFDRAVRFFVLNRITFSGTVESGGFSLEAFHKRFTDSSIDRLAKLDKILAGVKITNLDYSELLKPLDKDIFIFLDPPYFAATKSKLYGKGGNLHTSFDHKRFADELRQCSYQWLVTYDDSFTIRENFKFANIFEWEMQYGMNNYKQTTAAIGKELFIANYPINPSQMKNLENSIESSNDTQLSLNLFG